MSVEVAGGGFPLQTLLLAELKPSERDLFGQISSLKNGLALLAFFHNNPNTYSTADSIAFRTKEPASVIQTVLQAFQKMGLVIRLDVGPTLWRFTDDEEMRIQAAAVVNWQKRWRIRLTRVENAIQGKPSESGSKYCGGSASDACDGNADCWKCASFLVATVGHLGRSIQ